MKSHIYQGQVRHRRNSPRPHTFQYRMFMMYLDLAELDTVFQGRWLWSARRFALARFRREHHLGDPSVPLDTAVRDLVKTSTGSRPHGPIRLLTQLSYFGYVFNPVSFYYCFNETGSKLETIVAEVNNTPWGEQHCYVLPQNKNVGRLGHFRYQPNKEMHVSPFMPMDIDYDWRFNQPGENLTVHMENHQSGEKVFDATLVLQKRAITAASLAAVLVSFPLMTLKIMAAIHWQALRLWLKGTPVFDHPDKRSKVLEKTP